MKYVASKGVFDIVPSPRTAEDVWQASSRWNHVETVIRKTTDEYGYREIRTPVFEHTELFVRSVGDSSDIVTKEMYTFLDKGERSLTLRPEGTAPVVRAFVEHRLYEQSPVQKLFYLGPMFRYERPQAGRYRQHHQFGAEAIGVSSPEQDVEVIDLLCEVYRRLGLKDLSVTLNSVGDAETRGPFVKALHDYLKPRQSELSKDSQQRLEKNILRILDSKDPKDQAILENAPSILKMLDEKSKAHFDRVCTLLKGLRLPFVVNSKLVRGLDYYNRTVFEVVSGHLGAQNSIGGGGRYDGLIASLGGPPLPSVGFGTGLERILQTMEKQGAPFSEPPHPLLFFIPMGEEAVTFCFEQMTALRHQGIAVDMDLTGKKVQSGLQLANAMKATYAVVVGTEELASGIGKFKHMETRDVKEARFADLALFLKGQRDV